MDAVITYVDGLDPLWQEDYARYVGGAALTKRFRDWGTLRYLLRGIESFMPFIDKVHLVVSRDSQVPGWVDRKNVDIVLHEDIIPAEKLPVFNSCAIEMYLHEIPGLDEQFLYFNDDMFPVRPCKAETFFRDGRPVIGYSRCWLSANMYMKQTRRSDRMARKALGQKPCVSFVRPQHICSPMLKSECAEAACRLKDEIDASVTRLRTDDSLNQYLFLDYMLYKGKAINERLSRKHFSLAVSTADKICRFLQAPDADLACINDVQMSEQKYLVLRKQILEAFEGLLPGKSKFEI